VPPVETLGKREDFKPVPGRRSQAYLICHAPQRLSVFARFRRREPVLPARRVRATSDRAWQRARRASFGRVTEASPCGDRAGKCHAAARRCHQASCPQRILVTHSADAPSTSCPDPRTDCVRSPQHTIAGETLATEPPLFLTAGRIIGPRHAQPRTRPPARRASGERT
jgi:hypothetical protein